MKIIHKYCFNLIEIAIATGVLSIGIISIIGVIPVILKQDLKTKNINYSRDAIINIQTLIYSEISVNFSVVANLPDNKPSGDDTINFGTEIVNNIYNLNPNVNGKYAFKYQTNSQADTITDFNGEVLVWKTYPNIQSQISNGTINTDINSDTDRIIGINVEISYPAEKAYIEREKKYCYFEIFNNKI